MAKQKIAILGGGTGSLSAALGLTSSPNWQDQYEITVYQVGWRLGGKGASGRNPEQHHRIEEHGLHIWGGFYWNAFRAMRTCYEEMQRPPGSPLATVWDAFKPKSDCTVTERIDGQWVKWGVTMRSRSDLPGDDYDAPSVAEHIRKLITWMIEHLENGGLFGQLKDSTAAHAQPTVSDRVWDRVLSVDKWLRGNSDATVASEHRDVSTFDRALGVVGEAVQWLSQGVRHLAQTVVDDVGMVDHEVFKLLAELVSGLRTHLRDWIDANPNHDMPLRREFLVLDFGFTTILGLIEDDVLRQGFSSIDDVEWRDWLRKHGAAESTINSVITKATYDYVFGYLNGDVNTPSIGAGTCTHGLLLLTMCYQGAIFFEMQGGMGDTVFTPLYLVLKKRGVRFEFFHRVDAIRLDRQDANAIGEIDVGVQMTVRGGEYNPLVDVVGLPCWPSTPGYDQLERGDELKQSGQNLESPWADWPDAAKRTLRRGEDFDLVVLGISVAALPALTPELMAANSKWLDMVTKIQTTQTQAMQVWMRSSSEELGWSTQAAPVVTGYADDMNTWGDLSHLLAREAWPAAAPPKNESYYCGPLKDATPIPPFSDHTFPDRMAEQVKQESMAWLEANTEFLMPKLAPAGQFDWSQLQAPDGTTGKDRFDSQYWRANVAPSERYVISAAGTTKYRLPPDGSGFSNLYLAGDWVETEINAGCVEAAVMAGLGASQAICGYPQKILGVPSK
ncbi:MAG: NAD(P)-binding protein [Pirellula sp.]